MDNSIETTVVIENPSPSPQTSPHTFFSQNDPSTLSRKRLSPRSPTHYLSPFQPIKVRFFSFSFIQTARYSFPGDLDVKPISPGKLEELLDDARSQFLLFCLFDSQSFESSRAYILDSFTKRSVDVSTRRKERHRKQRIDKIERN